MKSKTNVLSADLGGESGRVMGVAYNGRAFHIEELHRFTNVPALVNGALHWDILRLWNDLKDGIIKGKSLKPVSVGIDTWGVDFVLLDERDTLLSNPVHHRDKRTNGMMEKVFTKVSREEIFNETGIQFMSINTLYQIMSLVENQPRLLSAAKTFLTPPDLLNFWLTGIKLCEFTSATTTQMFNSRTNTWATDLMQKLQIPVHIFPEVVKPGTRIGNYEDMEVITVAAHDTGSAVAAVPARTSNFVYISSGTWSLVGLELPAPIINNEALKANVTNEGGVYGTFRFLKNVIGLWILQECRRTWQTEGYYYSYNDLISLAELEPPLQSYIYPNDPVFLHPGNHPGAIRDFCRKTSQPIPLTTGAVVRCVLESLALTYKDVINQLLKISGRKAEVIHIVGGGSKNKFLNQLTANATGLPVIAGPSEATVTGNAIVQFIAMGELGSLQEAREIIANMPELEHYEPKDKMIWDEAYLKYSRNSIMENSF
ncbi:MAG: rhamnulokinase family protein [Ignavibacteriaceae bacterium]